MIYIAVPADEMLTQGDIVDGVTVYRSDVDGLPVSHQVQAIVLTQACDLAQGKALRVVIGVVHEVAKVVASGALKPATIRDQVRPGKVHGFYFLPESLQNPTFPESIVDLRDLHTVSKAAMERVAAEGKRVARLTTPYREHLAQHFAVTYMRIALPDPYESKP